MTIPRVSQKRRQKPKGCQCEALFCGRGHYPGCPMFEGYSSIKKKKRPAKETNRIYGPPARRRWMKTLPCSACGIVGYSEGAHVLGNGGMSRKADADTQAPLCGPHTVINRITRNSWDAFVYIGCHKLFDDYRWEFDEDHPKYDPANAACSTNEAWIAYSGLTKRN